MKMSTLLVVAFCIASAPQINGQPDKILRVSTGEWPPYISKNLPNKGCVASMLEKALQVKGYSVQFTFLPWKRAYIEAQQGKYDATAYWFDSKERRKDFLFPENNITTEKSFFYFLKSSNLELESYDDLMDKTVIINLGYTYGEQFWREIKKKNVRLSTVGSESQNFKMILAGRADFTVISEKTGDHFLAKLPVDSAARIKKSKAPAMVTKGYMLISKKNALGMDISSDFDEGFQTIMSDELYRESYKQKCSDF